MKPYHPYHPHGEAVFLTLIGIVGILWLIAPVSIVIKVIGAVGLYTILPAIFLREYWPKLRLHDLGWRLPERPRHPATFAAVIIALAFIPVLLFTSVSDPAIYTTVTLQNNWLGWIIGEGLVAIIFLAQAAGFTGLLLFRLTHLMHPTVAIVVVGFILSIGQLFLPRSLGPLTFPLMTGLAWTAWQTRSFVPAVIIQVFLTILYDLLVRVT